MKTGKKQIAFWIFTVLTVCFYLLGRYRMHDLEKKTGTICFVKTGEGSLMVPQDEEYMESVLWTELGDRQVQSEALQKSAEADVIAMHGRSDILFPNMPVIDASCRQSCLVSEPLAYELFGGTDVKGLEVTYQGNVYQVLGILERQEKLFLYEPSEKDCVVYNRFSMKRTEQKAINALEQELTVKYGSGRVLDYELQELFFHLCFLIIPLSAGVLALKRIFKCWREDRKQWKKMIVPGIVLVILMIAAVEVMKHMEYPLDMIPDKWSNFEFWTQRAREKKEAWEFLVRVQKTYIDVEVLQLVNSVKRILSLVLVMVLLCIGCAGKEKSK